MKRDDAPPFLRGYIDAALFTTDPEPPSGQDYVESGRSADLWPRLPDWWLDEAKRDCARFQFDNAQLLPQAGDEIQNGMDFWYTRNSHGTGYWSRNYDEGIANALTRACKKLGEHYLLAEDFGMVTE